MKSMAKMEYKLKHHQLMNKINLLNWGEYVE
jgi:hypothetical protein